jgi:HSP20 family protein
MATSSVRWMLELAPAFSRRRSLIRFAAREGHVLVPSRTAFEPPTDVYEADNAVIVRMEVSGLKDNAGDITVEIQDDLLTIAGERKDPASGAGRRYEQIEIQTGRFERTVRLPCPVIETDASARYDDGFLVVTLPRRAPTRAEVRMVRID